MVCLHQGDQSPFYCLFSFNIVLKKSYNTPLSSHSGKGEDCQLGHGDVNNISTFKKVGELEGQSVSQVTCGYEHTVVLTSEGILYSFGSRKYGQTGHGIVEGYQSTPRKVSGCLESKKVVFVAANGEHTACITEGGDTYTWGNGQCGRLGHGDEISHSNPNFVKGLVRMTAKEIACVEAHTLVCTDDGKVYSFGDGQCGQLGHCNFRKKSTPTLIKQAQMEGKCVVQVACGWAHSMALASDGHIYTWGNGDDGRLGNGSELGSCIPSIMEKFLGYKIVHIESLHNHSIALVDDLHASVHAKKMKAMVNDETCSDVIFLLKDGDRVHANKGLLIELSKYFRAMFRSGMAESKKNEVEVGDCSKGVFLLLLAYLYKGEVEVGMDYALDLYVLSDRYQENVLSKQCLEVIEAELTDFLI